MPPEEHESGKHIGWGFSRWKRNVLLFPNVRRFAMDRFQWEEEKEQRRAEYLKWHAQMAKLFGEGRLAFERERKRLLDEFFNGIENEDMRRRLRVLQTSF